MTTEIAEKPKRHPHRKDYTDFEVEVGLTALALCSGHRDKAAELVKETHGLEIPAETIRSWGTRTRVQDYARIREQIAPQLQEQLADVHQSLAVAAAEIEAKTINRLDQRLTSGDVEDKDLANILKNAAIAGGVHVDKAQLLNDRPTQIIKRDATEVMRKLQSRGVVVEAEVVSEETLEESGSSAGAVAAQAPESPS